MRTAKTLIRLGGCPGCSESSLGARAILLVMELAHVLTKWHVTVQPWLVISQQFKKNTWLRKALAINGCLLKTGKFLLICHLWELKPWPLETGQQVRGYTNILTRFSAHHRCNMPFHW